MKTKLPKCGCRNCKDKKGEDLKPKRFSIFDCLDLLLDAAIVIIIFFGLLFAVQYFLASQANAGMRRGTHSVPIISVGGAPTAGGGGSSSGDLILMEDDVSFLLLEDGSKILLE